MTTTTVTGLELLRTRMAAALAAQLPGHIERLNWDTAIWIYRFAETALWVQRDFDFESERI